AWSYADLAEAAVALADELRALGVQGGDRVLIATENCAPAVAALFATSSIGATLIFFNARLTESDLARILDHATPAALLFCDAVSAEAKAHGERFAAAPLRAVRGQLSAVARASDPAPELHDVATILYTTGTTGTPKGVMLSHSNLLYAGRVSCDARGVRAEDVLYGVLPLSHVFGVASVVMAAITGGASVRLEPRFSPAQLYAALQNGLTLLSAVPQMLAQLMHYTREQGFEQMPSLKLRYISSGAAPLDLDWKRKVEDFFKLPLQNGYGMTEASAGICLTTNRKFTDDISVGQALPGTAIKLDHQAPGGEDDIGEILIKGPGVMKGYFRNAEATANALGTDGWMRSGDLGRLDADGKLHIVGRSKELIIHGGFNVYPPEVEAALNQHPQVIQCAVIGIVQDGDEKVYAFVEASADNWPTEDELKSFAAEHLAGYKRPSRIIVVERLPAAATGKILKQHLPALLECRS
ncbi:MAG: class I adenylate-forming enzyme family protein, partial [Granulosicoccaceae bacterium]